MSPEQAMGEDLDGRTDIFSLGVVAFEMLSGRQPFPGNNVTSILYKLVHSDPVHPDDLEVLGLLPDKWHQVFSKVLAKDPNQRFGTAAEFVEELEHCLGSWFGSLEGETVIVKDPAAVLGRSPADVDRTVLVTSDRDGAVSDETVMSPGDAVTPSSSALDGATTTLERDLLPGDVVDTKTDAPVSDGTETVMVPPPQTGTEESLYEGPPAPPPAGPPPVAPKVSPEPAGASPADEARRVSSRNRSATSKLPLILGGVALLALVGLGSLLLSRGGDGGAAPPPAGDVPPPAPPPRFVVDSGSLTIVSEPSDADVTVNGELAGTTPIELELPLGEHAIVVDSPGFIAEELTTSMTDDARAQTTEINLRREPPRPAFLRIRSEPPGAQVELDGDVVGATPTEPIEVSVGTHALRITQEGFLPWQDTVRAQAGRTVDVDAVLTARRVVAEPEPETPPAPTRPTVERGTLVRRGDPGVVNPECIQCPAVGYPETARRARLEGVVELSFIIDENGEVSDIQVQESAGDIFDAAVANAVSEWRWAPATKYDVPVKIRWVQRFRFRQGR